MKIAKLMKAGIKFLCDPQYRFLIMAGMGMYNQLPDDEYLIRKYRAAMGKELHLDAPITFNEKLQWLKLYDRKPEYTMMVDKYAVRQYVADTIGEEYLIPLLGVWDSPNEIDFDALPNQFVLKCNHNSGLGMCICKDKSKLDIPKVKAELRKGLDQDYYLTGREWPYKNVPRKIIAEKFMTDFRYNQLVDYKLMCFNGMVYCTFTCTDRHLKDGLKVTFFDNSWKKLPFERHYSSETKEIQPPVQFEQMKKLAEILAKDISFGRVDFYEVNGKIYFGELTFFPGSGMEEFTPDEWDYKIGSWLVLPQKG